MENSNQAQGITQEFKQIFLLLCNKTNHSVIDTYKAIYEATLALGDCAILYHLKDNLPSELNEFNHSVFSDEVLTELNYIPIGYSLIPGNNHFPLLQFYLKNPNYDYYWCIEDDVKFSGEWSFFFNSFSTIDKDFITSHIRCSEEESEWSWWSALAHPYLNIPFEKRVRSFNPIYRISNKALRFIHESLLNKCCGHHEVLLPTLLLKADFKIMDFGGKGKFVLPGFENRFYISAEPNIRGILSDGTMRWRPTFTEIGNLVIWKINYIILLK